MDTTALILHTGAFPVPAPSAGSCEHARFVKKGFYHRACDSKRVQKYRCLDCKKGFSDQTGRDDYRMRTVRHWPELRRDLCSGAFRRRCAFNRGLTRRSVERALLRMAARAARDHAAFVRSLPPGEEIQFDEMESSVHTKWKPLSLPLVVTPERYILAMGIAQMGYKGSFARKALKKYGPRQDMRRLGLDAMLGAVAPLQRKDVRVVTDKCPLYPNLVAKHFPGARHVTTPGGRGCVVGYGELKMKSWDVMFPLNHSAAMLRDGLATLKRKTWTSTKKPTGLLPLLMLYVDFHNTVLVPPALERRRRREARRARARKGAADA